MVAISQPNEMDKFMEYLKTLTPDQRVLHMELIEHEYCRGCGNKHGGRGHCQCRNDE